MLKFNNIICVNVYTTLSASGLLFPNHNDI